MDEGPLPRSKAAPGAPDRSARDARPRGRRTWSASRVALAALCMLGLVAISTLAVARSAPLLARIAAVRGLVARPSTGAAPTATAATIVATHLTTGTFPLSALSPRLASTLDADGDQVGIAVYDVTHNRTFVYHASTQFLMGSSAKIGIMIEYLQAVEAQGRAPDEDEQGLLAAMMENSDNDAAEELYVATSYDAGLTAFMRRAGITAFTASPDGFGWATITPSGMVRLLTLLADGRLLDPGDRQLALGWMEDVEADQQQGVGDTAPAGATVAMKDGWVQGPDGAWAVNSSGIVTTGNDTYIMSVYTQELDSLDSGYAIVNAVCGAVARELD